MVSKTDAVKSILSEEEVEAKKQQLRAKLLKIKLAGINLPRFPSTPDARRGLVQDTRKVKKNSTGKNQKKQDQRRLTQEVDFVNNKKPIRPTGDDAKFTDKQSLAKAPTDLKKRRSKNKPSESVRPNIQGHAERSTKARGGGFDNKFSFYEGTKGNGKQLIRDPLGDPRDVAETESAARLTPEGKYHIPMNNITNKLKKKLAKIKQASVSKEHGHAIVFKGVPIGPYKTASLVENQGHYAKYWLLNAKQTNGNGWGIAAHTAKDNMSKFVGRPLVVTASSWHGASQYGDSYEHPYLATNDMNQIFAHQEKFRVGNIVSVEGDKNGDYFATIEMLPKFANMVLPPFCSPAIYQLDAQEHEGNISKWEALHLAALDENPAYGARIALLKGTCVGTSSSCSIQFKSAKLETGIVCDKVKKANIHKSIKAKIGMIKLKAKLAELDEDNSLKIETNWADFDEESESLERDMDMSTDVADVESYGSELDQRYEYRRKNFIQKPSVIKKANIFDEQEENKDKGSASNIKTNTKGNRAFNKRRKEMGLDPVPVVQPKRGLIASLKKKQKLRLKLAALGMNNMTYQGSKPVKIHKKKHPEVRKAAEEGIEDILRKSGSSVDGSHHQSTFLSSKGDYIGGGADHAQQATEAGHIGSSQDTDVISHEFSTKHSIPRVQTFPMNRGGEEKTTVQIGSKLNSTQLRSIRDIEKSGKTLGFAVGPQGNSQDVGDGFRDMMKAIRKHKLV